MAWAAMDPICSRRGCKARAGHCGGILRKSGFRLRRRMKASSLYFFILRGASMSSCACDAVR